MFIAAKSWKELNPYNEVLFGLKKEENSDLWINFDDILLNEISQTQKEWILWFHLCEVPRVVKFKKTGSRMVVSRNLGSLNGGLFV